MKDTAVKPGETPASFGIPVEPIVREDGVPCCHECGETKDVRKMSRHVWCRKCWNRYVRST